MSKTVAELLVGVLEQVGVKQIFGLIGDSLNPLGDAVRRSKIEWIRVRHEEGAALAAAGQAKLTGQLGVCAGPTGPGSTCRIVVAEGAPNVPHVELDKIENYAVTKIKEAVLAVTGG
ncbi:MAG: hypothetical protein K2X60_01905 [Xanthobacteraceae bacterium]|nr:hypothetical protein [Xanthobacteraceae bacterium]